MESYRAVDSMDWRAQGLQCVIIFNTFSAMKVTTISKKLSIIEPKFINYKMNSLIIMNNIHY